MVRTTESQGGIIPASLSGALTCRGLKKGTRRGHPHPDSLETLRRAGLGTFALKPARDMHVPAGPARDVTAGSAGRLLSAHRPLPSSPHQLTSSPQLPTGRAPLHASSSRVGHDRMCSCRTQVWRVSLPLLPRPLPRPTSPKVVCGGRRARAASWQAAGRSNDDPSR